MKSKKKWKILVPLILVTIIMLLPYYIMLVMSTHTTAEIYKAEVLIPGKAFLQNLKTVFFTGGYARAYVNSICISVVATACGVIISALAGFSLAKYNYKFKKHFMNFVMIMLMVPTQLGVVGFVIEMKGLHMLENPIIPLTLCWFANSFGVFWMQSFIQDAIPNEILESSRIDGCSEGKIFLKMVLPLIKPALVTMALLMFLWSWNSYLYPLVLVTKDIHRTVPLAISTMGGTYVADMGARVMGMVLGTFPLIVIFSIGSKYLISGLTTGAVKG